MSPELQSQVDALLAAVRAAPVSPEAKRVAISMWGWSHLNEDEPEPTDFRSALGREALESEEWGQDASAVVERCEAEADAAR